MLNRVVLVGRMVRDPELRRTGNGTAVTSFTIAVNRAFSNQNGEKEADFIPCVVWQKGAENTAKYCSKGSLVGVDGRLQSRTYEDNNGNKRTVIEVVCDSVQFLESKNSNQEQGNNKYQNTQNANAYTRDFDLDRDSFDIQDEDIAF